MNIYLEKIVYTFIQETNTNGTTGKCDESEELEITVEPCINSIHKEGGFIVLRTKGWSIQDGFEIKNLIELVEFGVGSEKDMIDP